jgi:hypothetical protein
MVNRNPYVISIIPTLCRHSLNLRLADMWLLPLALNPPAALLATAFGNFSSSTAAFVPVQSMGKLDTLMKWLLIPSYPLFIAFKSLLPQSRFCWIFVLHYGVSFLSEILSIFQLLHAYFRGKKSLFYELWDQSVDHFHARLPYAAVSFSVAYFSYYCLWFILPFSLIRAPM